MLRLSPPGYERFLQSPVLGATFGGGEANVAVSLALFGIDSYYVTRLPAHDIGEAAVRALRAEGVKNRFHHPRRRSRRRLLRRSRREPAGVERHLRSRALGDQRARAGNGGLAEGVCRRRLVSRDRYHARTRREGRGVHARVDRAAKKAGAKVSVDLNFRKKLWTEAQAQKVMRPLMGQVDLVIANEEDMQSVLGLEVPNTDVTSGHLNWTATRASPQRLTKELGPPLVAITLRESVSASDNGWSAVLWDDEAGRSSRASVTTCAWSIESAAATVLPAGLIYGLLTGRDPEASLRLPSRPAR